MYLYRKTVENGNTVLIFPHIAGKGVMDFPHPPGPHDATSG
jgi:hypothetical protein